MSKQKETRETSKIRNFLFCSKDFHTVGHIVRNELTLQEQERMMKHILDAVKDLDAMDAVTITATMLRGENPMNGLIIQEAIKFILTNSQRYIESNNHQKNKFS